MTYPFRAGIDYGPRDGTLGISYHMSEGGDELVSFLGRHDGEDLWQWATRVNGVSCHAALLSDGTIWQMLGWDRTCGNLNPDDRSGEYGYYGASRLKAVLGTHWWDPNEWTVSMEIAGRRADGPTPAQVAAAIRWGNEMKALFPTIRGAIGHHDQSPKACPGLTANMKAIFTGIGGHGLWQEDSDVIPKPITSTVPKLVDVPAGAQWYGLDGAPDGGAHSALVKYPSPYGVGTLRAILARQANGSYLAVLVKPSLTVDLPPADRPAGFEAAKSRAAQIATNAAASIAAMVDP